MNIEQYKNTFTDPTLWFKEEINRPHHMKRISDVIGNKYYLSGKHKVSYREDAVFKGKELITRKTIIQYAKTILQFHSTYMLGKPLTLSGEQNTVDTYNDIYSLGNYDLTDYEIIDRVNKFGDAYEVIYVDNGRIIKSKVLDSGDCYPVYDDLGNYLALVEHWSDAFSNVSYWNVFYPTYVEHWSNEGGSEICLSSDVNVCGLPIHYHNFNDEDYLFGRSMLDDIKPLLDELEDVYSKLGDAIYVNTLNPMPVSMGVRLDNAIPADATGYVLNMENGGDFKYVAATMDYNNIKFYIESLRTMINEVACIPAVLSNSEVSNISEMSMKMLFHLAGIKEMDNEKWLTTGLQKRFTTWKSLLKLQGIEVDGKVDITFNLSRPIDNDALFNDLKLMKDMNAISTKTIMEQSGLIKDARAEETRLSEENSLPVDSANNNDNGVKTA